MIKIKVSCQDKLVENLRRMIPENSIIDNVKFYFKNENIEYDYWLVIHASGLEKIETAMCAKDRIIYASLEADEVISRACKKFLDQFHFAFSCDDQLESPVKINLSLQHWWVGMKVRFKNGNHVISKDCSMNYHSLSKPVKVLKLDRISVILSNKDSISGHRQRREYIEKLISSRVGKFIDVYGSDFIPVEDKWDALVGYKYHLSIENMVKDNYWTEKFVDPLLAECLNFYIGCPNISDYFPKDSFIHMSYEDDFEETLVLIEDALDDNLYGKHVKAVLRGKHAVMNENNLFFVIAKKFNAPNLNKKAITLYPNSLLNNPFRYVAKKLLGYWSINPNKA
jgi:hypothetical protein